MLKIKNARDLMMVVLENKVKGRNLTNEFLVPRIKAGGVGGLKKILGCWRRNNVQHSSGLTVTIFFCFVILSLSKDRATKKGFPLLSPSPSAVYLFLPAGRQVQHLLKRRLV